jgi:hypothetical protein
VPIRRGEAELKKVPNASRIYYFNFKLRGKPKQFFWLQEISEDNDIVYEELINQCLELEEV